MRKRIILASASAIRAKLLRDAGVEFEIMRPGVDEAAIKNAAGRTDLEDLAMQLAEAKALSAAETAMDPEALIIGSDQIMELDGEPFDKPTSMDEAAERLKLFSGRVHSLINATVVAQDDKILWRNLARPQLAMRVLTDSEIADYVAAAGEDILSSVGAYQIEKLGSRLFDRIEGDAFAVQGLALLPLLAFLRGEGALRF